jgi:glycosyltransferase involved in cell wall biosynthesis
VVVIQWWTTFWAPAFGTLAWLLRRAGIRVAFLVHNVLPHEEWPCDESLARLALRVAHGYIVQTEGERARLLSLLPNLSAGSVRVCAHPVYDMFVEKAISAHDARHELGLPDKVPVLLFFGIVRPYKGLRYLLEAMASLEKRGRQLRLVVAGEFWGDKGIYLTLMAEQGLSECVTIVDRYIPNEAVALYFSACDVVVLPYQRATQSGVAALAHAFDKPVIASGLDSEMAAIGRGQRVILVPPADSVALADAIDGFFESTPRDQVLIATRTTDGEHDWECLVQAIEEAGRMA